MNFKICKFFCAIFSKLLCFIKKRKKSRDETSYSATTNAPLSTIQIQGSGVSIDNSFIEHDIQKFPYKNGDVEGLKVFHVWDRGWPF